MTFSIIVCSIGAFVYFGLNMMSRVSPNTIIAEQYFSTPQYMNITKDNFFVSFGMRNFDTGVITSDASLFTPELNVVSINRTKQEISTVSVSLGHCNDSDIPQNPDLGDYFIINPVSNMSCVKDFFPLEMQGSLDSDYYEYISLTIKKCNSSEKTNCKDSDEMDDFFNNNEFFLLYTSYYVDPLNYDRPLNQHGNFYSIPTNNITKSLVFIEYQHLFVNTDDGVVLKDTHTNRAIAKMNDKAYFSPRSSNQNYLELRINLDKVAKIYERTYDKLQEVLANTGGSIKILMIFALLITKPVVSFYFYRDLSNEYFDFELPDQNNKMIKTKMDINIFEYYLSFIKKKDAKLQLRKKTWDKAKNILDINLSLSQILMKISEIEKLKFLILEKDQLVLFEYIPKPIISEHNEICREIFKRSTYHNLATGVWKFNETFFKKYMAEDMQTAFEEISMKKKKNRIDHIILKLIVQEIKDKLKINYDFNEKKKEEDFTKILSHSQDGINEMVQSPQNFLYIDAKVIVDDLESLKKGKN